MAGIRQQGPLGTQVLDIKSTNITTLLGQPKSEKQLFNWRAPRPARLWMHSFHDLEPRVLIVNREKAANAARLRLKKQHSDKKQSRSSRCGDY